MGRIGTKRDKTVLPGSTRDSTGVQVQVRLQPDLLKAVDKFRKSEPDLPTRPEAIRRLTLRGLETLPKKRSSRAKDDA